MGCGWAATRDGCGPGLLQLQLLLQRLRLFEPIAQSIITFAEVSAGRGFVCGLQAGGAALFCWPSTPAPQWGQLRRLYNGPDPLADLVGGGDHVAAYEANTSASRIGRVLWWRGRDRFPA